MQHHNSVLSGLIWSFAERFGAQIVSFAVSIILARILLPEDYGVIAMVTVFINIANAFVTGGFGNSLIQKKDADDLDFSTMFYFNIAFSICIYLILFFIAPYIETFYQQEGLTCVTRILGIRLLFTGINSIQRAFVAKRMQFKLFFFATLGGTLLSAAVGIILACNGFGVWALVAQYLTNTTTDTLILWITVKWRPKKMFSFIRLKRLVSYGWKLLCSSLLSSFYTELNSLVIGKFYTVDNLAYYSKGKSIPALFVINLNSAIETVLFPDMSKDQENTELLKYKTKKSIQLSTFIVFPIVFGLASAAESIVLALLTEKWIETAKYISIACISFAFVPVSMANIQVIKAVGRSDIYLQLDIVKKIVGLICLIIALPYGVISVALAEALSNFLGFLFNMIPNRKILGYGVREQLKDILPSLLTSLVMAFIVYLIGTFNIAVWYKLVIQVAVGVILYISIAKAFNNPAWSVFQSIIEKYRGKV